MRPRFDQETIPSLFAQTIDARGDAVAVLLPGDDGSVKSISWAEFASDVDRFATTLGGLGVSPGDRVVHVSNNRYEWLVTDLALHATRAVHVPVHGTHSGEQIAGQFEHCGATVAVVEEPAVLERFAHRVARSFSAITYDGQAEGAVGQAEVIAVAAETNGAATHASGKWLQAAVDATSPDDLATILYTSGTTGEPKGVMLSQRNLATNCIAVSTVVSAAAHEIRLNSLPLSHIYARTCDLYTWLYTGARIAIARRRETVIEDCSLVRPQTLNGVPYFYEKLIQYLSAAGKGDEPGALASLLGGRIRLCCCGGAALPKPIAQFFEKQRVPLIPGYGLTESSPVISIARPDRYVVGTVGPPIDGVEVEIASDGEVLTRGPHVMIGYYHNQEATSAALQDGWLQTGDFGAIDDAGNLIIRGRKKELIVLATGKNVTPTHIEGLLTSSRLIDQAIVVGDDRNFIAALIHPEATELEKEIECRNLKLPPPHERGSDPHIRRLYEQEIAICTAAVSHWEKVKAFTLLDRPFTIEANEVTPKLSLRRNVILDHYRDTIEAMYAPAERQQGAAPS